MKVLRDEEGTRLMHYIHNYLVPGPSPPSGFEKKKAFTEVENSGKKVLSLGPIQGLLDL
jgi:hypothetical protein